MATLTLPARGPPLPELHDRLHDEHGVEARLFVFEGRRCLRLSAQRYNHVGEYELLARLLPGLL